MANGARKVPTTKWVRVTPAMAERWLEKNTLNRPLADSVVNSLADDMRNGRWEENPQVIIIDTDKNLVDGQHRLWAIVESGKTIAFQVTTDALPESRDVVDTGRTRTTGHMMAMHGIANPGKVASVARMGLMYESARGLPWGTKDIRPTKKAILEFGLEHAEILTRASLLSQRMTADRIAHIPNRMFGGAMYAVLRYSSHTDMIDEWVEGVGKGLGLEAGDPRLALRKVGSGGASWMRGGIPGEQVGVAITIKAWNLWANSRTAQFLRWSLSELPMAKPD